MNSLELLFLCCREKNSGDICLLQVEYKIISCGDTVITSFSVFHSFLLQYSNKANTFSEVLSG